MTKDRIDRGTRDAAQPRTRLDEGPPRVAPRHANPDALAARLRRVTLADIGDIFDGPHATPTRRESGNNYFLNISSLSDGRLDLANSDRIDDLEFERWTRRVQPRESDLLFSYETRLGEAALMPPGITACLGRRMALLRPKKDEVVPRFLLYYWLSPEFQSQIEQRSIRGATVDRIPLSELGTWPIRLPSFGEQKAIAEVLGALDDKIAANRRVMETADDLLRMQVKKLWQTDEVAKLGEVLKLQYGKSLPMTLRQDGEVSVVGSGGVVGMHNSSLIEGPCVVVGRKGTVGATYWIDGPAFPIDTTYWVEPLGVPLIYAYYLLESIDFASMSTDSAVPGLNRERAYAIKVPAPTPSLIDAFAENNADLVALRAASTRENRALAAARDELLPFLMSGKISVKDAEGQIDDATAH